MRTIETFTGKRSQIRLAQSFMRWTKGNIRFLYITLANLGDDSRHFDSVRILKDINSNASSIASMIDREGAIPSFQIWLDTLSEDMIGAFINNCPRFIEALQRL